MADHHDPVERDEPPNDPDRESPGDDRYIPTPEEIESGDAPTVPVRPQSEEIGEEASGFFERFRMRRRKGVGKKRKYVTPETQTDAGGGKNGKPPDTAGVPAVLGNEPPDRDEGGVEEALPAADDSQQVAAAGEDWPGQNEQAIEVGEGKQGDEHEESGDDEPEPDQSPPPAQRVESVSVERRREKKPELKSERWVSPREKSIERLFRNAEEHGHSMGDLNPDPGSDNRTARCSSCGLRATLVASREDMSTYVRYDIRGRALERKCES